MFSLGNPTAEAGIMLGSVGAVATAADTAMKIGHEIAERHRDDQAQQDFENWQLEWSAAAAKGDANKLSLLLADRRRTYGERLPHASMGGEAGAGLHTGGAAG